ncbi:hypothetical protein ILYODFUR_038822 [Ilyodon furcidens]|uniref:Uncharacterized protein n=1 Tax=Ilyodon furcidens TaxID=33524 RepID=A0ABV0UEP4_9TELE
MIQKRLRSVYQSETGSKCLFAYIFLYRFEEGLKTLGVLDAVKQHPDSFRSLFCHEPQRLTADMMDDLFTPRLAPKGSNRRRAEDAVIPLWRDYLQDAEGNLQILSSCL